MKIVIIEDERLTAKDLEEIILEVRSGATIEAILYSVKQAVNYFEHHPAPDLIFSDIQLGDGLSFEIFDKVAVAAPIVFCTAYDEYALEAFRLKGIDYVLKPFTREEIQASLAKHKDLSEVFSGHHDVVDQLQELLEGARQPRASSILVNHREKIIPVRMDDVAVFYIENQSTYLTLFSGETYYYNRTLDQIQQVAGGKFFRVNRQFLVNRSAVKNASHHLSRKLSVSLTIPFGHTITMSKEKFGDFMAWLSTY